MINKSIILAFLVLVSGCGVEYEPLVEWTGNITERSDRFILSYDTKQFPESQLPKVEQWWLEVQECVGVSIDISDRPLIIEYMEPEKLPYGRGGYIEWYDSYTRIAYEPFYITMPRAVKHEMIHYLIHLIDGSDKDNENHNHLFFDMIKSCYVSL